MIVDPTKKYKIVVAMSGGVGSSTVAAMLHAQGHEIIGITLQLYDYGIAVGRRGACCAGQDIYDAKMVAGRLGIPHYVLDYESRFKESVIDDFVDSYTRGETPLPCVKCNQSVKFVDLLKVSNELGADFLATGHYVRRIDGKNGPELWTGVDQTKDQSYFLFATTLEQLNKLYFPLGGMNKIETRKLALSFELDNADKPDSQDICFVPNGDYREVIKKLRPEAFEPGKIIHVEGFELGEHQGIVNYTIGQRRGLNISYSEPLYVVKIDNLTKTVYVGSDSFLKCSKFLVKDLNWLQEPKESDDIEIKVRSTATLAHAKVKKLEENLYQVSMLEFERAVTPGQACVFYNNQQVLGGGWIVGMMED